MIIKTVLKNIRSVLTAHRAFRDAKILEEAKHIVESHGGLMFLAWDVEYTGPSRDQLRRELMDTVDYCMNYNEQDDQDEY